MGSSVAHVCGHLHTLRGLVDGLYGRHPSGHLELELADFKDNRRLKYTCVCVCAPTAAHLFNAVLHASVRSQYECFALHVL